jgi:nucleotide-binding universal stress UspA family protein
MYSRVAVAIDSSPQVEPMLKLAIRLVRPWEGRLDVFYVDHPADGPPDRDAKAPCGAADLGELTAQLQRDTGVAVELHTVGSSWSQMVKLARAAAPELVVARAPLNLADRDRATSALVRRCTAPVLLLRGRADPALRLSRVLVALDGSEFSTTILEPVIALTRATGSEISLLRAPGQRLGTRHAEECQDYLSAVRDAFPPDLRPAIRRSIHSDPTTAIVREAQCGYDLIAMATHGWGNPREWVVGSTARRVMACARLPMLVYHPAGRAIRCEPAWVV